MDIPGYAIHGPIAHGGMATTYLATQESLQREVVLKVLDLRAVAKPAMAERFLNEGRIVAGLRHPNIITIFDVGTSGNLAYISMEYIDGGDLKSRLERGVIAAPDALAIVDQIATGLAVAHRGGIIHRDVKPGNILFRADGTAVLSDFGIAKQLTTDANLTSSGTFIGSPNYMPPEQADGGPIDARADIYSLGVLLFEMLTGRKPYLADSVVDVILKHKREPIPRLPEALATYQELLDLMLAKRPADRFRDVDSLLHYLHRLQRGRHRPERQSSGAVTAADDTVARATRVRLAARRPARRRAVLLLVLAVLGVGYAALDIAVDRLNAPVQRPVTGQSLDLEPIATLPAATGEDPSDRAQVITALQWLARHSLDEYRLTAPAKDNAYYYYARLSQIDPNGTDAAAGFKEIANRLARLAEREQAGNNRDKAQSYIDLGLRIDPGNESLRALQTLMQPRDRSAFDVIRGWFR